MIAATHRSGFRPHTLIHIGHDEEASVGDRKRVQQTAADKIGVDAADHTALCKMMTGDARISDTHTLGTKCDQGYEPASQGPAT